MSWKPEVIADNSGKWCGNLLRFATKLEAERYVENLAYRWTEVIAKRVVECDDAVNSAIVGNKLVSVEEKPHE